MKLETGYYWVHLKYGLTIREEGDSDWEVCHYSAKEDEWTECGSDNDVNVDDILQIDPKKLERHDPPHH